MLAAILKNPWAGVALATAFLLLIPGVAMQFTPEVSWGPGDFVAAGVLVFGGGAATVVVLRHVTGHFRRAALILAVAGCLALLWAELAVGLFH